MSWNIQNLGVTKMNREIIIEWIALTVITFDIDLLIIIELRNIEALPKLSKILNDISTSLKKAPSGDYTRFYCSPKSETGTIYNPTTHSEYYGFIVKDAGTIKSFGFTGSKASDEYLIATGADLSLEELSGDTRIYGEKISNSFYMYNGTPSDKSRYNNHHFPGGRPPCWAHFQVGNIKLNIIAVHLRPEYNTAVEQMNELLKFDLVQIKGKTLIITGDFNTHGGELLNRDGTVNREQELAGKYELVECFPAFTRKSNPTHISGEVYDNFIIRKVENTIKNVSVVRILDVLTILKGIPGYGGALAECIYENKNNKDFNWKRANLRLEGLNAIFDGKKPNDDQQQALFLLISDHYPIVCEIV
jgi:hypothetical protein